MGGSCLCQGLPLGVLPTNTAGREAAESDAKHGGCSGESEPLLPADLLASLPARCQRGWGGAGSSQQREQERDFVSVLEEPEQLWLSFLGWTGAAFTAVGAGEPAMLRDTDPVPRSSPWPSA